MCREDWSAIGSVYPKGCHDFHKRQPPREPEIGCADLVTSILAFAVVLLLAVLVSGIAHRSVLSTAVMFLGAGFVLGVDVLDVIPVHANDEVVIRLAELALFSVLFTDGMRAGISELRNAWRLPTRALLFGLPLTLVINAVAAHFIASLPWLESFIVGAVLSPTDPVFAAAIVGREEIPFRLRHLLNVESGLNDGLALPVVIVLLAIAGTAGSANGWHITSEVGFGILLGIAIPAVAIALSRVRPLTPTTEYEPLYAFAIGLIIFSVTFITHANPYLAAFAGGATVASLSSRVRNAFHHFGELVAELLKLAAIFVFGALVSPSFLGDISIGGYVFAFVTVVVVRPIALAVALVRSELSIGEWLAAAWFGPKGFASVVYGLLVLDAGLGRSDEMFHLIALTVALSIVAHSSTDVVIAKFFEKQETDHLPAAGTGQEIPKSGM